MSKVVSHKRVVTSAIAPRVTRITFGIIIDFPNRFSIKFRIVTEVVLILLSQIVTITIHYNFKLILSGLIIPFPDISFTQHGNSRTLSYTTVLIA